MTTRGDLLLELATVRSRGYATEQYEHDPETRAIASPVRDHAGRITACITAILDSDSDPDQVPAHVCGHCRRIHNRTRRPATRGRLKRPASHAPAHGTSETAPTPPRPRAANGTSEPRLDDITEASACCPHLPRRTWSAFTTWPQVAKCSRRSTQCSLPSNCIPTSWVCLGRSRIGHLLVLVGNT
jgi:hypothetical protein